MLRPYLTTCRNHRALNDHLVRRAYFRLFGRDAMKYLCLVYQEEKQEANVPRDQIEQVKKDYWAFAEDIKKSGNYVGGEALQPTPTAKSVRVRNGKVSTTDGPYVETKEQLGGYYLINAKDLNDAVQVASRIPGSKHGTVEVRPIMEFNQP